MELPKITLSDSDAQKLADWAEQYKQSVLESLKPQPKDYGLRMLPREPGNPNKFMPQFKTEAHTYQIIGDMGIGFERYTLFQKLSLKRGFGRDFAQIYEALEKIKLGIAGETTVARLRADSIVSITALQDSVADFGNEQFDAALWLCTLFVLREGEDVASYSEAVAEEKIKDWAAYGYSELDFFFLSGNMVPNYGNLFKQAISQNEKAREKLMDAIATNGRLSKESEVK